jgi:hypothetical protein
MGDERENLAQKAIAHFGTTHNPAESGYIMPGGQHLDLTGRHYATGYTNKRPNPGQPDYLRGTRSVDHRELPDELSPKGGTEGMFDFMHRSGAVRHMPESPGISAVTMPTDAQLKAAVRAHGRGTFYADAEHPHTMETLGSEEFERPTVEKLRAFFKKHHARQQKAEGGPVDDPDQPQRQLSPVGLYSHAADVVQKFPQMRGTPAQFKAMLTKQGVKPDEFKYSNYDQAFAGKPMVTKDELTQHFNASVPPVRETTLTNTPARELAARAGRPWESLTEAERDRFRDEHESHPSTKFDQYTLPGGTNYRETLLHLPPKYGTWINGDPVTAEDIATPHGRDTAARVAGYSDDTYKSGHWDTPNVLAHLRMSDRALPGGQKALHLEELQSDWAQEGRKKGFKGSYGSNDLAEATDPHNMSARDRDTHWYIRSPDNVYRIAKEKHPTLAGAMAYIRREKPINASGVPDAPYVDSTQKWVDLGLKRALYEAAKGGYHKLVMTPGEEQAKRYDLSKHVNGVRYFPETQNLQATLHNGRKGIDEHNVKPEDVEKFVGKDVAKKLLAVPAKQTGMFPYPHHFLGGLDLKVGGEGMKAFYDKMLPAALEKLAKKHDPEAKVHLHGQKASVDARPRSWGHFSDWVSSHPEHQGMTRDRQYQAWTSGRRSPLVKEFLDKDKAEAGLHSLDITPKMRESILKGQPAYAGGGKVETPEVAAPEPAETPKAPIVSLADLKRVGETWGYNSPHFIKAREAHDKPPEPELKADGAPVEAEKPEERIVGALKDWLREERATGGVVGLVPHMHAGAGSGAGRLEKMRRQSGDLSPNQKLLPLDGDPLIEKALALAQDATAYKNGGAVEKAADKQELEKLEATIARQGDAIDKLTRLLSAPQIVERDENNRIKRIYREMPK